VISDGKEYNIHNRDFISDFLYKDTATVEDKNNHVAKYYADYLIGREFISVSTEVDQDDDIVYIRAYVDENNFISIPSEFDAEHWEIGSLLKEIISKEEFESFKQEYQAPLIAHKMKFERVKAASKFYTAFKEKLAQHFSYLIGHTIEELTEYHADSYDTGDVLLSDGREYPVHYKELLDPYRDEYDEDSIQKILNNYFNGYLKDRKIKTVEASRYPGHEIVYLTAITNENHFIDISLGFDPENWEIHGLLKEVISEDEFDRFKQEQEHLITV